MASSVPKNNVFTTFVESVSTHHNFVYFIKQGCRRKDQMLWMSKSAVQDMLGHLLSLEAMSV